MISIRPVFQALLFAIGIISVGGCQGPWQTGDQARTYSSAPRMNGREPARNAAVADSRAEVMAERPAEQTQEEAMADVLMELEEIGEIDQHDRQELMAELRAAKPENWSLIVHQYKSALAFKKQLAAKDSKPGDSSSFGSQKSSPAAAQQVSFDATDKTSAREKFSDINTSDSQPSNFASESGAVVVSDDQPEESTTMSEVANSEAAMASAKPLPLPQPEDTERQQSTYVARPTQSSIRQVSYEAPVEAASSWQEHLQGAITNLEKTAAQDPSNTVEVHDHMRLRMLRMLAGEEENALIPIPGASSMQQDYWSKQLFAVSTFLDSKSQPDAKRRAAGSLIQLDHARANLSEMATMQLRNLTFVDSVDGFGVYEPRADAKFRPGDQVTLYTEVDSFRSESTKEGYRTTLGTSYEVLDTKGQRVDSAQFPDVEDLCRNRRHDFHMQYGVALPTRIYAGEYQMRITVTDQLSHKISQLSIPFEIVE